jgi:hypothetical protein
VREILDLLILILATARLTRLVIVDELGMWALRAPLYRAAGFDPLNGEEPATLRAKAVTGLTCPFCVGFWLGLTLLVPLVLTGGPGHAAPAWEAAAGAFALNYLAGHLSAWADGQGE